MLDIKAGVFFVTHLNFTHPGLSVYLVQTPPHIHSNTHLTSTAIDNICCFLVTYGPVMSLTTKRIHLYIMNNSIFFCQVDKMIEIEIELPSTCNVPYTPLVLWARHLPPLPDAPLQLGQVTGSIQLPQRGRTVVSPQRGNPRIFKATIERIGSLSWVINIEIEISASSCWSPQSLTSRTFPTKVSTIVI